MNRSAIIRGNQGGPAPDGLLGNQLTSILVVDDDAALRGVFAEALAHSGYVTDDADDGVEGWNKLQSASYSLLITDNNMPKMSGVELIRKVRAAHMDLPVILATSDPPRDTEALQLAAILRKPFTLKTLRETVEDVFHFGLVGGASPLLKRLARLVLVIDAEDGVPLGRVDDVAFGVFERLRGPIGRVAGAGGYHSLLSRAQALAGEETLWLRALRIETDGSLAGPEGPDMQPDAGAMNEGEVVLLAQLLGLMHTLIGSALTQRLLQDIWPGLDDLDS
jgi:two-component system chemotaxis response regulator CheY